MEEKPSYPTPQELSFAIDQFTQSLKQLQEIFPDAVQNAHLRTLLSLQNWQSFQSLFTDPKDFQNIFQTVDGLGIISQDNNDVAAGIITYKEDTLFGQINLSKYNPEDKQNHHSARIAFSLPINNLDQTGNISLVVTDASTNYTQSWPKNSS